MPSVLGPRRTPHAVVVPSTSRSIGAARAWYQSPTRSGSSPPEDEPSRDAIASPTTTARSATAASAIPRCANFGDNVLRCLKELSERLSHEVVELQRQLSPGAHALAEMHERETRARGRNFRPASLPTAPLHGHP